MESPDRLEALVTRLGQEDKNDSIGLFYLFWGTMNILGTWISMLAWSGTAALFWVFWIPFGIVLQTGLLRWLVQTKGRIRWNGGLIPRTWTSILLVLPLFIWFFPEVLHLYPFTWIFPLTSAWVALGSFATGMMAGRVSVLVGSLGFWATAPLYLVWPDQAPVLFTVASLVALIIPGGIAFRADRT